MSITDQIKERLDIVEVISNYVPLKKAGRNYQGLCPFHNEKTPSFVVFPDGQSWHCFGACGTGGDIFTFIMKRENLDFGEALEQLAARAGVELRPRAGQLSADEQHLGRLREIVADAALYFHYLLNKSGEAEIARSYLEERGLRPETWENWQLGYALDSWDALKDRLVGKGYTPEEVEEAGLIVRREDGSGFYDRFRDRLMIPIRDWRGRTIGFGARILREDPDHPQPKYINSPQTPLFDKGNVLYGLDMARKAIRDADRAVIVEGYLDVLMSHQVGVYNVVAGMGTALTESQIRQLRRYTSNLTLALDPDVAGDRATLRGLEAARQTLAREWEPVVGPTGLVRQESRLKAQIRIAALPDGLDPDELARNDVERWRQVIAEAKPIVDYYLALISREEDLTSARGKANAVERMAPLIREIANPVEREHYTQRLARLIRADERLVAEQVAQPRVAPPRPPGGVASRMADRADEQPPDGAVNGSQWVAGLEEHILGHLLFRPDLLARLDAEMIGLHAPPLSPEDFARAENRSILAALQAIPSLGGAWLPDEVLEEMPAVLQERCRTLLERTQRNPMLTDEKLSKDLGDSVLRLRARNLQGQIKQIQFLIMEAKDSDTPDEQLRRYYDLVVAYTAQKRHIGQLLSARSLLGAHARPPAERIT
jgi:DNA primase